MRLQGKTALITGAARGIGKAIAARFAAEGAAVIVSDIDLEGAEQTATAITDGGARAVALSLDVTQPEAAKRAVDFACERYGRLDILVNNAGLTTKASLLEMSLATWEQILRVNLTGTMLCSQAAARSMIGSGGGRIINLTSISGQRGGSNRAAYGASKAGIINLTAVMAIELAPHNIVVNAIAPGLTDVEQPRGTPAQRHSVLSRMAIQRPVQPREVAAAAVYLASDDCGMVTGHVLNVDGGYNVAGIVDHGGTTPA
jgi:3-oxoacyl-[acyl-carrier protein] reductase